MSYKAIKFERLELNVWEDDNGFYISNDDRVVFLFDDNMLHGGKGNSSWNCYCKTLKEAETRLETYKNTRV